VDPRAAPYIVEKRQISLPDWKLHCLHLAVQPVSCTLCWQWYPIFCSLNYFSVKFFIC